MREPVRIGFMPMSHAAPLVFAKETGLFAKCELDVELVREPSWSTIGDKVINGDLDAALAPASLPFIANLGVDNDASSLVSGMVVALQGCGITISRRLFQEGVQDSGSLLDVIYRRWGKKTCTLGVPSEFSTEYFLLEDWLESGGVNPRTQVRIILVPADQMYATLKLGYIDAFCAPEPWNSLAIQAGEAICLTTSVELAALHPQAALVVRQSFSNGRTDEHERLVAALMESCAACDQPENRRMLCGMLSNPQLVNAPVEALAASFVGPFDPGFLKGLPSPGIIFGQHEANVPDEKKATWIMQRLYSVLDKGVEGPRASDRSLVLKNAFRLDIFERASGLSKSKVNPFECAEVKPSGLCSVL